MNDLCQWGVWGMSVRCDDARTVEVKHPTIGWTPLCPRHDQMWPWGWARRPPPEGEVYE